MLDPAEEDDDHDVEMATTMLSTTLVRRTARKIILATSIGRA